MSKEHVDIGFIIPLREEFERLIATFPRISDGTHGTQYHAILDMGDDKLTGVAFIQNEMGKDAAARATTTLLDLYDVGLIMVLGIAGGLSGDAAIGDVCITGTVFDVLENAKFSDNNGRLLPEFAPIIHHTDELLSFCVKYISLGKDTAGIFDDWRLSQYYAALARIPGEFIGRNNTNEAIAIPDIHVGSIACGAVSKSEDYVSALKKLDRKILAIETESGGVFKVAYTANVPAVTIRGICDYADKNKTRLEQQTNNQARFVAADNVITFVKAQLENQQFIRFVENRRQSTLDGVLFPQGDANSQGLPKILKKIDETIHYHLTQLSPHYQNKPQGYRLPLPRIKRPEERISATPMSRSQEPMGILEAIATNQTILMITPRNYPDSSLPWIIAAEVRRVELNGRQAIPIVLNAESIKPPHGKISDSDVDEIERLDDSSIVFILADFPVLSKSRVTFFKKEIERYPRARFVFVNRSIYKSVGDSPFMVGVPAGLFDVIDIPFAEMSNFFQRSFNLAEQEASVIAWRMKRMFDKFDLIAHPSFFSGVQSEALSSLLKANRRTELLQLAVSGFLSFVVASDESDVVLNRTTREEFLRKLVFEKNVNVRSFDPEQTVAFASEFAEGKDYDISPIEFVRAFIEKGIIHFGDGKLVVSLPFIESYLLALELTIRAGEAARYFNPSEESFDVTTFDIYSELGASDEVVKAVTTALVRIRSAIGLTEGETHILLTNTIRPSLVGKPEKLRVFKKMLDSAVEDVVKEHSTGAKKQRIIDLAEHVDVAARSAQGRAQEVKAENEPDESLILEATRCWSIATVLLGSGSERLTKMPKRQLAAEIVKTASALVNRTLKRMPKDLLADLRRAVLNDEKLRRDLGIIDEGGKETGRIQLIQDLVDVYEFSLYGYPLQSIFSQLGNVAGQSVLGVSVASLKSDDLVETLIAKIWLGEIGATKAKKDLIDCIAELPPVWFLRVILVTHFLMRVFWDHWERDNRLALLDVAAETIKPLGRDLDKRSIERVVGTSSS